MTYHFQALFPDLSGRLLAAAEQAMAVCAPLWQQHDQIALTNQARVLEAFRQAGVAAYHLAESTGYGYGDPGRDALASVYAAAFGAEAALVRPQIASGTHAITCGLFGNLRPGDELLAAAAAPYDTLQAVIRGGAGSLTDWGVAYREVPLGAGGRVDPAAVAAALSERTRVVLIQRSRGYSLRPSLFIEEIGAIIAAVKARRPDVLCLVDNCYGEFVEDREPTHVGADLCMGSLIKNPGGGIAPTGGYIAGKSELVENAACRLTAPGIGSEVGPSLGMSRLMLQGFFVAPHVAAQAAKGAQFTAAFFGALGLATAPDPGPRTDLVQAVTLGSAEALAAFCRAVQMASPVDSTARPEPAPMPGYADPVVMAAGAFVQGSSIELSADGPLRPPYAAYFQGGLTQEHVLWAALFAARELEKQGLLPG